MLAASGGGSRISTDYIRLITKMIYDEPSVMGSIAMLQSCCLRQGIVLRWGNTPPTPSFHAHIQKHFLPFCREAILSCLAVGFVPFRLRREGNLVIPEVLPLGTYTWSVTRNEQRQSSDKKRKAAEWHPSQIVSNPPLLKYEVNCSYCEDQIHVFNYITPQATLTCFSPLSGLIFHYNTLLSLRELAQRAEIWNARPNIVLEEQEKTFINDVANTGACITQVHQQFSAGMEQNNRMARQETLLDMVEITKERISMPQESTVFVAPKNNTTKALDKSEVPAELMKREMCFARSVALALGIPGSFAGQGSQAATSGASSGWIESPEMYGRGMMEACLRLNQAMQDLLSMTYGLIYAGDQERSMPTFSIPLAPNLPYELLLPLFESQVLDDKAYSHLFEASTGFPLGQRAVAARDERHKATTIMPFLDKGRDEKKKH